MKRSALLRLNPALMTTGFEDRNQSLRRAGFAGIELAVEPHGGSQLGLDEVVKGRLPAPGREGERPIYAVSARCWFTDVESAAKALNRWLGSAPPLPVQCLNLTLPALDRSADRKGFPGYQEALDFAYQLLRRVRFEVERAGVTLAIEAAAGNWLLSPVELRELIDSADSWAVGACVDVGRTARVGLPEDWLTILSARVHAVRIHGSYLLDRALEPSGHAVDVQAVADALDRIRYAGLVILSGPVDFSRIRTTIERFGCMVPQPGQEEP